MAVIADIIREVSLDLNDQEPGHEYVRWPFVQLHSYLREGLIDVSYRLKDLFTSSVVVEVESGEYWQKACTCTKVLRVVGLSTPQGRITRRLRRYLDTDEFIWAGAPEAPCPVQRGKDYLPHGYSINAEDHSRFRLIPSVPYGEKRHVVIECYRQPTGNDKHSSVPDEIVPMLKQWMLYRAMMVDSENNAAIVSVGKQHQETYFQLLKLALADREEEDKQNADLRTLQKGSSQ